VKTVFQFLNFHIPPEPIVYIDYVSKNASQSEHLYVNEENLKNNFYTYHLRAKIVNLTTPEPETLIGICSKNEHTEISNYGVSIDYGDTRNLTEDKAPLTIIKVQKVSKEQNMTMQSKLKKIQKYGSVYSNSTTSAIRIIENLDKVFQDKSDKNFVILWVHKKGLAFSSSIFLACASCSSLRRLKKKKLNKKLNKQPQNWQKKKLNEKQNKRQKN
jgi:hypothetical protein